MTDSTAGFDGRAEGYDRFRPSYPAEILTFLGTEVGLDAAHVLVDVGAGTGKLTRILLENGNRVYAVEPNDRMREMAEKNLSPYEKHISVKGTAEATNVPDRAADFVFAAQAFHWFDVKRTHREFRRILREGGVVVLIWNVRNTDESDFLAAYDEILRRFSPDYTARKRDRMDEGKIGSLYGSRGYQTAYFPYSQALSEEGLIGRVLSNSYAPASGDDGFDEMCAAVRALFGTYNENGSVSLDYTTNVLYGTV